jgi:hypothetical protein
VPTFAGSFFSAWGYVAARLSDGQVRRRVPALLKLKTPSPAVKKQRKPSDVAILGLLIGLRGRLALFSHLSEGGLSFFHENL